MSVDRKHLSVVGEGPRVQPENADLETAVYDALAHAGGLDPSYIFVTARGSDITLAGWVFVSEEISLAEQVTLSTHGVRSVHNELSRYL